jgi:hypothetical protein
MISHILQSDYRLLYQAWLKAVSINIYLLQAAAKANLKQQPIDDTDLRQAVSPWASFWTKPRACAGGSPACSQGSRKEAHSGTQSGGYPGN